MKLVLLIAFFFLVQASIFAQAEDKLSQIEKVQTVVGKLVARRRQAEVLLTDLSQVNGSVTAVTENSFSLKIKNANGRKALIKIMYADVVEIKSKDASISFMPDPQTRRFGSWDDVLKIDYNHNLEVVLENGERILGRLGGKTTEQVTVLGESVEQKILIPREKILYLYRVRYGFSKAKQGSADGAGNGRKVGDAIGNTSDGKAVAAGIGAVLGAGIGALVGGAKKEVELKLLVYSK